jgi:RND family efflux transporter MFP subunit
MMKHRAEGNILMRSTRFTILITCVFIMVFASGNVRADVEAVTTAKQDLELGFTIGGKVAKVQVKPGQEVQEGQILVELEDFEGEALIKLYRLRASSNLEVRSAEEELKLAKIEEAAIRQAFEKDAAKPIELDRAQIESAKAELAVSLSQQRSEEATYQLRQTMAHHDQYLMRAPLAGVVDAVEIEPGETVQELTPILRLVVTDPLRVDAAVPTDETLRLKVGGSAWVRSSLPGYEDPIKGRIVHMAFVADAASNTRLVRVDIPNTRRLPAGSPVMVSFVEPVEKGASAVGASEQGH